MNVLIDANIALYLLGVDETLLLPRQEGRG
jgi:hypothetical protein